MKARGEGWAAANGQRKRSWAWALCAAVAISTPLAAAEGPPVEAVVSGLEAAVGGGGPSVGIKVHGRWRITVRNTDGSMASRTEFNNALVPSGGQFIAQLLARTATDATRWRVALVGNAETLLIVEQGAEQGSNRFPNLTVSPVAGSPALTLVGSAKASTAENLVSVRTDLEIYDQRGRISRVTPFTSAALQPGQPTQVQAGQTIDVTVVLSFS